MEALIFGMVALAATQLVGAVVQLARFKDAFFVVGMGRIAFLGLVALVAWAGAYTTYVALAVNVDWPRTLRLSINLVFAVYLVIYGFALNVAIYRWRHSELSIRQYCSSYYNYLREWGRTYAPWNRH